jgi:hypothetical protein
MKSKYLLLKPAKIDERTLDHLDDEADSTDWAMRAKELQTRRWRKLNRRMRQGEVY